MWTLGIESTAHTLSFGLVDKNGIPYPASTSTIKPEKGGIHPREAVDHHKESAARLLQSASVASRLPLQIFLQSLIHRAQV